MKKKNERKQYENVILYENKLKNKHKHKFSST